MTRPVAVQLSVGGPKDRPFATIELAPYELMGAPRAVQLHAILQALPAGPETWWSAITWRERWRRGDRWQGAHAAVVDLDHYDEHGEHAAPPAGRAASLAALAAAGGLPCNVWHASPRGARLVLVFDRPVRDAVLYQQASRGAAEMARAAVADASLMAKLGADGKPRDGFAPDDSAHDLVRFMFAPRAVVGGVQRAAAVELLRVEPYNAAELAALAPLEPEPAAPAAPPDAPHARRAPLPAGAGAADSAVRVAARRRRERQPVDWGAPGSRACPMCGRGPHPFGKLPAAEGYWCCWSAHHGQITGGVGQQKGSKWIGDVNDFDAHRRGCTLVQLLVADGFLVRTLCADCGCVEFLRLPEAAPLCWHCSRAAAAATVDRAALAATVGQWLRQRGDADPEREAIAWESTLPVDWQDLPEHALPGFDAPLLAGAGATRA